MSTSTSKVQGILKEVEPTPMRIIHTRRLMSWDDHW